MEDLAEPSLASEGSIMVVDLLKVTSAAFAETLTQRMPTSSKAEKKIHIIPGEGKAAKLY